MIGRVIGGRYRLIGPLGEGGMATLWRAVDEQLDREVAVKLLRAQYSADAGFAARFKQEARAAGSLAHPNIVPVYDYGSEGEDQTQYIVMQLVEGRDLAGILRERGELETDDAVRVGIGVASALEAAHRRGIVHRDVKPGNILITDDGDVKVTDFGIARAVSEASMTVTGTTLGSVHYFSPEQARGDEVTGRSDVYALGIVLFEMLTGRRPFEGDSAAGVALKRLNEDPPPPSRFHPVPPGLEAIVMRALERDPARRFPDAGSMAEALRMWQKDPDAVPAGVAVPAAAAAPIPASGEPTVYVPPPVARPSDRGAVPPRRPAPAPYEEREGQPWWVWVLAALALLLLGLIGFLGAQILGGLGPGPTPSATPTTFALPNWVGDPITQVRTEAEDLGLAPLDEQREPSEGVPQGRVIRTDPEPGTQVAEGDEVTVVVSSGPREVEVPNVIGQTEDSASQTIRNAGLEVGAVDTEPSSQPQGRVISTFPAPGVSVPEGSQVDLVVSSGPTPPPTPSPTESPTPSPSPSAPPTESPTPSPSA